MRTGSGFVDDDGYLNASAKKTAALENAEVIAVRKRFPDPKRLIEDLGEEGFKVVTIIDPGIKVEKG